MDAWVLSDGVAGNRRQAEALAAALGVQPESLLLRTRAPWRWTAPRLLAGASHAFGAQLATRLLHAPPQLAIGCGRQAALATRLLQARHGGRCRTVQILDPRVPPSLYGAVIAPVHDGLQGANVVRCTGSLHPVDDAWLARARARFAALAELPAPRTVLLLGGPTRGLHMDAAWFEALATVLEAWRLRDGGSLLVSSSRRTPDWLRQAVRSRFAGVPGLQWHGPDDGENPYPGLLAHADRIVVTPDSANLMSEAAATGRPVLVHAPQALRGKLSLLYCSLRDGDQLRPLEPGFTPWSPTPLRELARVAAEVRALLDLHGGPPERRLRDQAQQPASQPPA